MGLKDGKCCQKVVKDQQAEVFVGKCLGDTVSGNEIGFPGYEFVITGGSDKCGFPMRKGIQLARLKVMVGKSVGFCGLNRNEKKQNGLLKKRTVCGERITSSINQVNLKVTKEGPEPLVAAAAEAAKEA